MSDNIVDLDAARRSQKGGKPATYELLAQLDELESALETLDEHGIATRDELVALIARLESEIENPGDS